MSKKPNVKGKFDKIVYGTFSAALEEMSEVRCDPEEYLDALHRALNLLELYIEAAKEDVARSK